MFNLASSLYISFNVLTDAIFTVFKRNHQEQVKANTYFYIRNPILTYPTSQQHKEI